MHFSTMKVDRFPPKPDAAWPEAHFCLICILGITNPQNPDPSLLLSLRIPVKQRSVVVRQGKGGSHMDISRCVVDALPELRNGRAFAERWPGKVFCNFYQEHRRGQYAWNDADLTVSCNRTESLDASHHEIQNGRVVPPRESDMVREFAKHLHNVAKRLEENEDTGSKRYVYVKLGPDHFRHVFNYEAMARQYGAGSFFEGCDLS